MTIYECFFLLRPLWLIRFPQAICIRPIQQSNYSAGGQFAHERIYARTVVTHGGLTRHVMRPRESKQKAVCLILSCVCVCRKADAYPAVVYCTCTVPIDAIARSPYQQQQVYIHAVVSCGAAFGASYSGLLLTALSVSCRLDWILWCAGFRIPLGLPTELARSILYVFPMCAGGLCSFMFQVRW
jgi:hypothetical protein